MMLQVVSEGAGGCCYYWSQFLPWYFKAFSLILEWKGSMPYIETSVRNTSYCSWAELSDKAMQKTSYFRAFSGVNLHNEHIVPYTMELFQWLLSTSSSFNQFKVPWRKLELNPHSCTEFSDRAVHGWRQNEVSSLMVQASVDFVYYELNYFSHAEFPYNCEINLQLWSFLSHHSYVNHFMPPFGEKQELISSTINWIIEMSFLELFGLTSLFFV